MILTGRNWTRRSIEELVENYIREHGGGGNESVKYSIVPGGIRAGGVIQDYGYIGSSTSPLIYYEGMKVEQVGRTKKFKPQFCCFITYDPSFQSAGSVTAQQHEIYSQTWTVNDHLYSTDECLATVCALPFGGLAYTPLLTSIEKMCNGGTSNSNSSNITVTKDEFTGGDDHFGEPGVYFQASKRVTSGYSNDVTYVWCKIANAVIASDLFPESNSLQIVTNNAIPSAICTTLNDIQSELMAVHYPDWSQYCAMWRIVLPKGNIDPGTKIFQFEYPDRNETATGSYSYTYHEEYKVLTRAS